MDSNAPDHKPQATLDSQAIGPQPPDPSLALFSVTPLIRTELTLMYAHSGRTMQFL